MDTGRGHGRQGSYIARGAQQEAQNAVKKENALSDQYNNTAQGLSSTLTPLYTAEATNPQGFSPEDLGAMNTASEQSLGGAVAGAEGQGNLQAARTRNAGGFQPALSESARSGQRQLSQNAVGIQGDNAKMREMNRQAGISGLHGMYGQNNAQTLSALGLVPGTINAEANAGNNGWFQNMTGFINAAANAAKAAASFKNGGGGGGGGN